MEARDQAAAEQACQRTQFFMAELKKAGLLMEWYPRLVTGRQPDAALCDDDYEFLGVPDPQLKSSWEHCRNIVLRAEEGGFDNILLPSGYQLGVDTIHVVVVVGNIPP